MDMKMMPGQEPYTQDQLEYLNELMRGACAAEEVEDLDELERHSMKIDMVKNKAAALGLDVQWAPANQAWFVMEYHVPGAVGDQRKVLKVSSKIDEINAFLDDYERI
jgi:hypothetical protein